MGMTAEVFHKVGPALTIYSGRPRVDQQMAPKIVLMALPDMTPQKVEDILAARTTAKINMDGQTVPSGMLDPSIPLNGRAFSITAAIDYLGGQLKRKAVIRLTGDPLRPYLVLAWN